MVWMVLGAFHRLNQLLVVTRAPLTLARVWPVCIYLRLSIDNMNLFCMREKPRISWQAMNGSRWRSMDHFPDVKTAVVNQSAQGEARSIINNGQLSYEDSIFLPERTGKETMRKCFGSGAWTPGFLSRTPVCFARRMRGGRRTRHREPNPGDWLCQCGETNYRSKRECFKCGAPAPPLPPGVRRPSLPGEDPHDWACACGQMNFRGSVVCHKCAQPKPVPPGQETPLWTCPGCKGINREHRKTCFKCGAVSPNIVFSASTKS